MIDSIRIRNLGVIAESEMVLGNGMVAITGETGAGKTMALTSLSLLMGGKADSSLVRAGHDEACVTGEFIVSAQSPVVALIEGAGGKIDIDGDDAVIVISRQIRIQGRSRAFVGGQTVPQAFLREIADELVTVHGQMDQLRLKSASKQRQALDDFGGADLAAAKTKYEDAFAAFEQAQADLTAFELQVKDATNQRLALESFVRRVDEVKPREGEPEELRALALSLENVTELREATSAALEKLDGTEESAVGFLSSAAQLLSRAGIHHPELAAFAQEIHECSIVISEIVNSLREYDDSIEADPGKLDEIHQRRAVLTSLERDLAMTITEIIEKHESADELLTQMTDPAKHLDQLRQNREERLADVLRYGQELTKCRRGAAQQLSECVTAELTGLAMKDATFCVSLDSLDAPSKTGLDAIEFLLEPHHGAGLHPLSATASGGEMSRIMLAIEVTLSGANPASDHTFIFDEIDAGIGGKTALSVGKRLASLGTTCQVLVVTHLAQVAAHATHQLVVEKDSNAVEALTRVYEVTGEDRERELARMLSGYADSETARSHAAELLQGKPMGT